MDSSTDLKELAAEHEALLTFMYMSPAGILRLDGAGNIEAANPMSAQLLMPIAPNGEMKNLFLMFGDLAPELRNMAQAFEPERGYICENHRLYLPPRASAPSVLSCSLLKIDALCLMVSLTDVSGQVAQERRVKQTESWLAAVHSVVNDFAFFSLDRDGLIDNWNQSGVGQTGFAQDEVLGRSPSLFCHPDSNAPGKIDEHLRLARETGWHVEEQWCQSRDGRRYWGQLLVSALDESDGVVSGYSVVLRDVTERKLSVDRLKELLTTDHLTGAMNRGHFREVGETEVARSRRFRQPLSLIMLDADHFKSINDTLGHAGGDFVLKRLVSCCQGPLRAVDVLARIGGEEFAILLPATDVGEAAIVAERIRQAVAEQALAFNGNTIRYSISLGCATLDQGGLDTLDRLMAGADKALYRAKASGRNCVVSHRDLPG